MATLEERHQAVMDELARGVDVPYAVMLNPVQLPTGTFLRRDVLVFDRGIHRSSAEFYRITTDHEGTIHLLDAAGENREEVYMEPVWLAGWFDLFSEEFGGY